MPRAGGSCLFRVGCRLCAAFESFCPSFMRSNSNTTTGFPFPADGVLFRGFCAKAAIFQNCPIRRYPQYSHKISQRTFPLSRFFLPEPRFLFIKKNGDRSRRFGSGRRFPFKCRIVRKARDSFQDTPRFFENTESASLCLSSAINDLPILRRFVKSFHARGSASPADRPSASSPGTNASPRRRRIFKNKSRFFKKSFCYVDAVPFFVQKKSL